MRYPRKRYAKLRWDPMELPIERPVNDMRDYAVPVQPDGPLRNQLERPVAAVVNNYREPTAMERYAGLGVEADNIPRNPLNVFRELTAEEEQQAMEVADEIELEEEMIMATEDAEFQQAADEVEFHQAMEQATADVELEQAMLHVPSPVTEQDRMNHIPTPPVSRAKLEWEAKMAQARRRADRRAESPRRVRFDESPDLTLFRGLTNPQFTMPGPRGRPDLDTSFRSIYREIEPFGGIREALHNDARRWNYTGYDTHELTRQAIDSFPTGDRRMPPWITNPTPPPVPVPPDPNAYVNYEGTRRAFRPFIMDDSHLLSDENDDLELLPDHLIAPEPRYAQPTNLARHYHDRTVESDLWAPPDYVWFDRDDISHQLPIHNVQTGAFDAFEIRDGVLAPYSENELYDLS